MDLAIIGAFIDLAKKLYEPLRQYAKYKDGNQERIANFCEKISECLGSMASAATDKKSVAAYTGELSTYMDSLMDLFEGLIPDWRLKEFSEKLNHATIQGRLVSELTDESSRTKAVNEIMEASGAFRGLGALLKLKKSDVVVMVYTERPKGPHVISLQKAEKHEARYYRQVAKENLG